MANRQRIIDTSLQLKDAGLVAASAAATVSAVAAVIDTGGGYTDGFVWINITAAEVDTGDEKYTIQLQGTNTAAFGGTDIVDLAMFYLGDATQLPGASDLTTGIVTLGFCNEFLGTIYQYIRLYTTVAGTIATGINYEAYLTKN